jgi:putative transposase
LCLERLEAKSTPKSALYPLGFLTSTNMLERLNQELKRRTHVVRIFPNAENCQRLVRALAVEVHENCLEATHYLNMDHLKEHTKEALRALAA